MITRVSRTASATDVFHAVADVNRRAIVSQHLAILLEGGLVRRRQLGRQRLYRLDPEPLRELHDWTSHYAKLWRGKLGRLRELLEEES